MSLDNILLIPGLWFCGSQVSIIYCECELLGTRFGVGTVFILLFGVGYFYSRVNQES